MASLFDVAPSYAPRANPNIRDLMLMQGEQRAHAAQTAGQNWANAIQGVGNAVSGGIQAYQADKQEKKQAEQMRARDAATADAIARFDPANPRDFLGRMVQIRGPKEGTQMAETILKFSQNGKDDNPETHLKTAHAGIGLYLAQSPEAQQANYGAFRAAIDPTVKRVGGGLELPPEWTPDLPGFLEKAQHAIGATVGIKDEKTPRGTMMTVPGPDGKPMQRLVSDEEAAKGVSTYIEPPKAKTAPVGSFEDFVLRKLGPDATADQVLAARQQYEAAGRAPKEVKPPQEFTLNPSGVVLSSYPPTQKDAVRKQAMASGLPVFESSSMQEKGSKIESIVSDAKELADLMGDPEVQGAIGPGAGWWTSLKSNFVSFPPKVQRTVQLMGSLSDSEMRKRSGASTTEPEFKRLLKFAADPSKPLGHNVVAVQGLLKSGAREYRDLAGVDIGGMTAAPSAPSALPSVSSQAEYDALPKGARYTSNGKTYTKGNK